MKQLKLKHSLSLLFISFAILIFGTCFLIENGGITYYAVIGLFKVIVPASAVFGVLGWMIGSMMEGSKNISKDLGYTNALLKDLLKEEGIDGSDDESSEINEQENI